MYGSFSYGSTSYGGSAGVIPPQHFTQTLLEVIIVVGSVLRWGRKTFGEIIIVFNPAPVINRTIIRFLTETVLVLDTVTRRITGKIFFEVISVTHLISRFLLRIYSEIVRAIDLISFMFRKIFVEVIHVIDIIGRGFLRTLSEVITVISSYSPKSPERGIVTGLNKDIGIILGENTPPRIGRIKTRK